jgi:hypothetical protein
LTQIVKKKKTCLALKKKVPHLKSTRPTKWAQGSTVTSGGNPQGSFMNTVNFAGTVWCREPWGLQVRCRPWDTECT